MIIEVAKEGRMDMSGQGLIRAIQNNSMPLLDLMVREAIQNSLDAFKKDTEYVTVKFGVDYFDNIRLADELEGISDTLLERYKGKYYKYLFIKDSGTEGLNGPMHFSEKSYSENRNLLKLVYDIAKAQENKGAGGSWGYGKTVYFRLGTGLVIYYSKIKLETGKYQSRLAACLVEDEKRRDALLRNSELNSHRGLAWWGQSFEFMSNGVLEKGTVPETDESEIKRFLSIFGFEPFADNETGTVILIPYIDEKKLLSNNIPAVGAEYIPWRSSVEEYIRIACQRWYAGRLNNKNYYAKQRQPYLRVSVNEEWIKDDDMSKTFSEFRALYNYALNRIEINTDGYHCKPVRLRNYFETPVVGYVAYRMYTAEELEMGHPFNNPSPFVFVKNEDHTNDYKDGDIIIAYYRKPGMTVDYDTSGEWVNKIKCDNENTGTFLMAAFVLNSDNRFNRTKITELDTIEEYFRASERADHTSWYDINVDDDYPKILEKIQKNIGKKINETYKEKEERKNEKSSSLSKMFSEVLLPPEGFGKKASSLGRGKTGVSGSTVHHKNSRLKVNYEKAELKGNRLFLPIEIKVNKAVDNLRFILEIAADGKNIPLDQWRNKVGLDVPFYIESVGRLSIKPENENDPSEIKDKVRVRMIKNKYGDRYGVLLSSEYAEGILMNAIVEIVVNDFMPEMICQLKESEKNA